MFETKPQNADDISIPCKADHSRNYTYDVKNFHFQAVRIVLFLLHFACWSRYLQCSAVIYQGVSNIEMFLVTSRRLMAVEQLSHQPFFQTVDQHIDISE